MNYSTISDETMTHLYNGYISLNNSPLSPKLRILIELLVSKINGCEYCIKLHSKEALKQGINEAKINQLLHWRKADCFDKAEQEVFAWAEELTQLKNKSLIQDTKLALYFSEREMVDITICISLINMFNRLAISMKTEE